MYYTVSQIASKLNVNPETVRRWIREGKLNAITSSCRKKGSRIDEKSLSDFLDKNPRYKISAEPINLQKSNMYQRFREIRMRVDAIEKLVSEIDNLLESL